MFSGWIFWALGASIIWGVGQVINKKNLDSLSPLVFNLLVTAIGFFIYLPYAFSQGFNLGHIRIADFLILSFTTSTYLLYFYIAYMGKISLTGTIWACYPVTTIIFSTIFLGERMTLMQLLFALLILLGVALLGLPENFREFKVEKWFWLAVAGAAIVGFADFLAKSIVNRISIGDYFLVYTFAAIPGMVAAFLLDKRGRITPRLPSRIWLMVLVGGLMMELGNVFFFTAFSKGPVSLIAPIVSSYQAITVVLALIFLKERLDLEKFRLWV